MLTPVQLETHFRGENYLDLVQGGVLGSTGVNPVLFFLARVVA